MEKVYIINIKDGIMNYEGYYTVKEQYECEGETFILIEENNDLIVLSNKWSQDFLYKVSGNSAVFCADTKENCHTWAKRYVIDKLSYHKKGVENFQSINSCLALY